MFKNKKIFVTGGTGFIGSNLIRRLVREGAEVYALVRETSNFWRLNDILEKVKFKVADLSDFGAVIKIVQDINPDGIFHLGATVIMQGIISEPNRVKKVNFDGTKNLVEALHDIDYDFFINTGTFTENYSDDEYSKSKKETTLFCKNYGINFKKPVITLQVFAPYGPYIQKGRLIFHVLVSAMGSDDIKMNSLPSVERDFIYVDDLVDLYLAAGEHAKENVGEVFDAGSGVKTTLEEMVRKALEIVSFDKKSERKVTWGVLPELSYDSESWCADTKKTFLHLGRSAKTDLKSGLQKTFEWLKNNPHLYKEAL